MRIHPTAIIDPAATVADDVQVGPYAIVGAGVTLASGVQLGAHVCISGPTDIGPHTRVYPHAVLGEDPQDKKYAGEQTRLEIGAHNTFREFSTANRGTVGGGG